MAIIGENQTHLWTSQLSALNAFSVYEQDDKNASFENVAHMVVYLRNGSDINSVKALLEKQLGQIPKIYVHAKVCRPTWLIEIECMAITAVKKRLPNFL